MVLSAVSLVEGGPWHEHELGNGHQDRFGNEYHWLPTPSEVLSADDSQENAEGPLSAPNLSETFSLHSNFGASQTIFLDFDGHTTSGTSWNNAFNGGEDIVTPAYSFTGDSSFTDSELTRIQAIWQRVSEDFIPFDVNVTTEDPGTAALSRSDSRDSDWGIRVVIGGNGSWFGSAGGVAYRNSFNYSSDTPVFVFEDRLSGNEKNVAEASSHEAGHALGLSHDGRTSPNETYYRGHGSGETGWAPIMGNSYSRSLTQWSKGEYAAADNQQDDLAVITTNNGFGYRSDDHGSSLGSATSLSVSQEIVSGNGIIERNTDYDWFSFTAQAGEVDLDVLPAERGPNLDLAAALYDATGSLIVSSNPVSSLSASLSATLAAGQYFVSITGVGKGDAQSGGYSDYGSLGSYSLAGTIDGAVLGQVTAVDDRVSVDEDATPTTIDVLSNDTNDAGGSLVITSVGAASNGGTVSISSGASISYRPAPNYFGQETFEYTIDNGNSATSDTATVTVTVAARNDAPTAADDSFAVALDTTTMLDVLSNDSSLPDGGETLTITSVSTGSAGGTIVVVNDDSIQYEPALGFVGEETFSYTINDGTIGSNDSASVTVEVYDPSQAINFNDYTIGSYGGQDKSGGATIEDGGLTLSLTGNTWKHIAFPYTVTEDTIVEFDFQSSREGEIHGFGFDTDTRLSIAQGFRVYGSQNVVGSWAYSASPDYSDAAPGIQHFTIPVGQVYTGSFEYLFFTNDHDVSNPDSSSSFSNFRVYEQGVEPPNNDAPSAVADSFSVGEDSGTTPLNVLANDTTDAGETLTITATSAGSAGGEISIVGGNSIQYTPAADFHGTETFNYTINDGTPGNDSTATVTVNVSPLADVSADTGQTTEDSQLVLDLLSNDSFSGAAQIASVTQGENGSVSINPNGTVSYAPAPDFNGTDSFSYTAISNGLPETAQVTITTLAEVDVVPDSAATNEQTPIDIDVLANDLFAGSPQLTAVTQPSSGSVSINPNGTVRYAPNAGFTGQESFSYTATSGGSSETGTVTVTVNALPQNDAPNAAADSFSVGEDSGTTPLNVLANDTTDAGEMLTITATSVGSAGGEISIVGGNLIHYRPAADFHGTETFNYTINDGTPGNDATATVSVNVSARGDVSADTGQTTEDSLLFLDLLANDSFSGAAQIASVTQGTNGTVSINPNGTVSYAPAPDFNGTDSFSYTAMSNGLPETAQVTVTTLAEVDVVPDSARTNEQTPIDIDVLANDLFAGSPQLTSVTQPTSGSVSINPNGTVRYAPNAGFTGQESFSYTATSAGSSETATVTVTVSPVTQQSSINFNDYTIGSYGGQDRSGGATIEDGGLTLSLTGNTWKQIAFPYTVTANTIVEFDFQSSREGEIHGFGFDTDLRLSFNNGFRVYGTQNVVGDWAYSASPDYSDAAPSIQHFSIPVGQFYTGSFEYLFFTNDHDVSNPDSSSSFSNFRVYEQGVEPPNNDAPSAVADSFSVGEDSGTTPLNVLANDTTDAGETLTITATSAGSAGGEISIVGGNSIQYTPAADFHGTETFNYTINDGTPGNDSTATVTVNVSPLADVSADTGQTTEDSQLVLDLLSNDSFSGTAQIASVTQGANGSVSINPNGTVSYAPAPDFNGTDSFSYTAISNGLPETAQVTITTLAEVDVVPDSAATNEQTPIDIDVLANDLFAGSPQLTAVTQPSSGSVSINPNGTVRYAPNAGFTGQESFSYTATSGGSSETGTVTVTVNALPQNDAPNAVADSFSVGEDSGTTPLNVLANDTTDAGETLTITATGVGSAGGSISVIGGNSIHYRPAADFHGTETFNYTINDGTPGNDATATVSVSVNPLADVVPDSAATNAQTPIDIDVLANDLFAGSPQLTSVTQPTSGSVSINPNGTVRYAPNAGFTGQESFSYTATSAGSSETATVTVTVSPVTQQSSINFNDYTVGSYGGQDRSGGATIEDGGLTLSLTGNTWKQIAFPYTVTANTIVEFDFQSSREGEIHGFGFDTDLRLSFNNGFRVYGTQNVVGDWAYSASPDYSDAAPGIQHFSIPVGQFYTGSFEYLFFTNDHDVNGADAQSFFSNFVVYEASSAIQAASDSPQTDEVGNRIHRDKVDSITNLTKLLRVSDSAAKIERVAKSIDSVFEALGSRKAEHESSSIESVIETIANAREFLSMSLQR